MDMYGASAFKTQGKKALEGKWQTAIIVCFVSQLISMLTTMVTVIGRRTGFFEFYTYTFQGLVLPTNVPANQGAIIWMIAIQLVNIFIIPSLTMGVYAYFTAIQRGENPSWRIVFSQLPHWWRNVRMFLAMGLFIFLWSMLFIFPGIVAAISYTLVPYLLLDHQSMGVMEGIRTSKNMMQGKKGFYFFLSLSFFGWMLLISFAEVFFGATVVGIAVIQIANLFLQVYMQSTYAAFYLQVSGAVSSNQLN